MNRTFLPTAPCPGRLFVVWGLYGYAMALVWRGMHGNAWTDGIAWLFALVAGMALLLGMREV